MSFIAENPLNIPEIETTPPPPIPGTRGLFAREDGWYDIDSQGNIQKLPLGDIVVDDVLDIESKNPISNSAVAYEIDNIHGFQGDFSGRVEVLESDLYGLYETVNQHAHFKGYFATNAKIQSTEATPNDFAYSAESGTKWVYEESEYGEGVWVDTKTPVPDQMTPASDTTPLVNGTASIGKESAYARGDHRHPTDTSRASAADVEELTNELNNLKKTSFDIVVDDTLDIESGNPISNRAVTEATEGIGNDVSVLREDVDGLYNTINQHAHFKGYFSTIEEFISTEATPNDFAYCAEGGCVWVYYENDGWQDTGAEVPDQLTPASNTTPLVNGSASIGKESAYARGDHRHPTDTTRASVAEVNALKADMEAVLDELHNYAQILISGGEA